MSNLQQADILQGQDTAENEKQAVTDRAALQVYNDVIEQQRDALGVPFNAETLDQVDRNLDIAEQTLDKIEQNFAEMGDNPTQEQLDENETLIKSLDVVLDKNDELLGMQTAEQRKDADARLVREAANSDSDVSLNGLDWEKMLMFLVAFLDGDENAMKDLVSVLKPDEEKNANPEATAQEKPDEQPTQQKPEENDTIPPADDVEVDDNGSRTLIAEEEQPKGYVNEGQGPLLTEVEKPADEAVSPLIAMAMADPTNSQGNILQSVFLNNSDRTVDQAQVVQVPFAPQPVVENPQPGQMEVADVQDVAENQSYYNQLDQKAMGLGG